jgi:hypothetical protein
MSENKRQKVSPLALESIHLDILHVICSYLTFEEETEKNLISRNLLALRLANKFFLSVVAQFFHKFLYFDVKSFRSLLPLSDAEKEMITNFPKEWRYSSFKKITDNLTIIYQETQPYDYRENGAVSALIQYLPPEATEPVLLSIVMCVFYDYIQISVAKINEQTSPAFLWTMSTAWGLVATFVSCICWGSQFIPIKEFPTGDGAFFQWCMCAGIWVSGFLFQMTRGNLNFERTAVLGGVFWATGIFS